MCGPALGGVGPFLCPPWKSLTTPFRRTILLATRLPGRWQMILDRRHSLQLPKAPGLLPKGRNLKDLFHDIDPFA
jgi:hypothetical protein